MTHIFDPADREKLDNPERREEMPPQETLVKAGIKPGDIILDVGCGMGYFSVPASQMVGPKGMVYAVDISGVMLADLRSKTAATGIFNIHTVQAAHGKLNIPEADFTLVIISDVLHEVEDKKAFLAAVAAAIKTDTKLSVIEWRKMETPKGPPLKERISEDEMQVLLKKAGFSEPRMTELSASHVLYTCKKV